MIKHIDYINQLDPSSSEMSEKNQKIADQIRAHVSTLGIVIVIAKERKHSGNGMIVTNHDLDIPLSRSGTT